MVVTGCPLRGGLSLPGDGLLRTLAALSLQPPWLHRPRDLPGGPHESPEGLEAGGDALLRQGLDSKGLLIEPVRGRAARAAPESPPHPGAKLIG